MVPALAGCGQLPRPFEPEGKGDNALLDLPDRTGVTVTGVTGDLSDEAVLAEAMAAALRRENVPATVAVGNRKTHWLLGAAERTGADGPGVARRLVWELYGPDGAPVETVRTRVSLPAAAWRGQDAEAGGLSEALAPAARKLAAAVQGSAPARTDLPGYPAGTRVVVQPVTGEPTALARALAGALTRQLRRRDLPLADRAGPGDVVIAGQLAVESAPGGGLPRLRLTWTVSRKGEAEPLGDLTQANGVPRSRLEGPPEPLANTIAEAAAPGVLRVLREAER